MTPEQPGSLTVTPATTRPLSIEDVATMLGDKMTTAREVLAEIARILGDNAIDALRTLDVESLAKIGGGLDRAAQDIATIRHAVAMAATVRATVDIASDAPNEHARNGFAGEVHLEDIRVSVILDINPTTGRIEKITPQSDKSPPPKLGQNQVYATISGSEYVKETHAANWSDDPKVQRSVDAQIEGILKQHGYVEKDDKRLQVGTITPGQIPSSRAWANPNGKLFRRWDKGSRKDLARERRKQLRK